MKRILAGLVVGILSISAANAQIKMSAGIKGGLAVATLYGSDATSFAEAAGGVKFPRIGADIGGAFDLSFNDRVGLLVEAHYAQKGMKIDAIHEIESWFTVMKLSYIDVPILLKVNLLQGPVTPYLVAGPQVSLKMSAKTGGQTQDGVAVTDENLGNINGLDFGAAVGAGVAYAAGPGKAVLEYRFGMGIKTVDSSSPGFSMKNIVPVTLMVGYMLNL